MKHDDDIDIGRVLDRWLATGTDVLPERVLDAALLDIQRSPRRGAWRASWRIRRMLSNTRLALAAGAVGLVIIGALGVGALRTVPGTGIGGSPSPSIVPTPSPSPAAPSLPALTGTLVFNVRNANGDDRAYAVAADGTDEHPLGPDGACCAVLSPDGRLVALSVPAGPGRFTTAVMGIDGSGYRAFTMDTGITDADARAWSPDGSHLAFQLADDADPTRNGIYVGRSSDGGGLARLTTNADGGGDVPLAFSPDGSQLLFDRVNVPDGSPDEGDLYVVGVDGGGLRRLNPEGSVVTLDFGSPASWSADGSTIAFAARNPAGSAQVYVTPRAGGPLQSIVDGGWITSARFSPDGASILFDRIDLPNGSSHRLLLVHPDGTGLRALQATGGMCCAQWSPDGDGLVVGGADALAIMHASGDGTDAVTVAEGDGAGDLAYNWYSWSPWGP